MGLTKTGRGNALRTSTSETGCFAFVRTLYLALDPSAVKAFKLTEIKELSILLIHWL